MIEKIGVMMIVALAVFGLAMLLGRNAKGGGCPYARMNGGKCGACNCADSERPKDNSRGDFQ